MAKRATSIEEIAAEVGRLFGATERHAKRWMDQRRTLLESLHRVREKATDLISDLSGETARQMKQRAQKKMAQIRIPRGNPLELLQGRKRRRMSAATRAKMRIAQKKRWAAVKKETAKGE